MKMEKQLKLIEDFYPGLNALTNYEVQQYPDYASYHEFQLFIAKRRKMIYELSIVPEDAVTFGGGEG